MLDAQLYFLSDQYYIDFPDDKLMKKSGHRRWRTSSAALFSGFSDAKNPAIYWLVPISSQYEKYQKIAQARIAEVLAAAIPSALARCWSATPLF